MKIIKILLIFVLITQFSSCAQSTHKPAPSVLPLSPSPSVSPQTQFSHWGAQQGTLQQFLDSSSLRYPGKDAGIAYVGYLDGPSEKDLLFYDLHSEGYLPFIRNIDPEKWQIGTLSGPILVFCIIPFGKDTTVDIYQQVSKDPLCYEKGDLLYHGSPQEPILLLSDYYNCSLMAEITTKGKTIPFIPVGYYNNEVWHPDLQGNQALADVSIHSGQGEIFDWQLTGQWSVNAMEEVSDQSHPTELLMTFEQDHTFRMSRKQIDSDKSSRYEGIWDWNGPGQLTVSFHNCLEPQKTMIRHWQVRTGLDDTLLLIDSGIYCLNNVDQYNASEYEWVNLSARAVQIKHALLSLYLNTADSSLSDEAVDILLRRIDPQGWLFELRCGLNTDSVSSTWYKVDPETLTAQNLNSGSISPLEPVLNSMQQDLELMSAAVSYFNIHYPDLEDPADFARILNEDNDLLYTRLYKSTAQGQIPLQDYIIHRSTAEAYDPDDPEGPVFNIYDLGYKPVG